MTDTSAKNSSNEESRSSSRYTDLVFIALTAGAFVVLGFQTLKSEPTTQSIPEPLPVSDAKAVEHFGGRISLVATSPVSFVMRDDGERFTQGATLPGGYVLANVSDTELSLESHDNNVIISLP